MVEQKVSAVLHRGLEAWRPGGHQHARCDRARLALRVRARRQVGRQLRRHYLPGADRRRHGQRQCRRCLHESDDYRPALTPVPHALHRCGVLACMTARQKMYYAISGNPAMSRRERVEWLEVRDGCARLASRARNGMAERFRRPHKDRAATRDTARRKNNCELGVWRIRCAERRDKFILAMS